MSTAIFRYPLIHIPAAGAIATCTQDEIRSFDYYGACHAGSTPGAGFFEFIPTGQGSLALAVGDVLGEGAPAGVIRSAARSAIRDMAVRHTGHAAGVLQELNKLLYWLSPEDYYTSVFYAHLDSARRLLRYVNAAHEPALLVRAEGGCERLDHSGGVLGLSHRTRFQAHARFLSPGDVLVTGGGTAGLCDPSQWRLWETAAAGAVRRNPHAPARDLLCAIVEAFLRSDERSRPIGDWTLALVRVRGAEAVEPDAALETAALAAA